MPDVLPQYGIILRSDIRRGLGGFFLGFAAQERLAEGSHSFSLSSSSYTTASHRPRSYSHIRFIAPSF